MIGHCYLPQRNFRQLFFFACKTLKSVAQNSRKAKPVPSFTYYFPKIPAANLNLSMRLLGCWVSINPVTFRPGKKRQPPIKPRKVLTRNDDAPKPARKKYCYRGSKKPYKFIPETFKDCQLPANEDTVIGTGTFIIFSFPFLFLFSVLFSFSFNS